MDVVELFHDKDLKMLTNFNIEDFPKLSYKNSNLISSDTICSCYYCCKSYLGNIIKEFTDVGEKTPICPKCGIDSVLPFEVDKETLQLARKKWF